MKKTYFLIAFLSIFILTTNVYAETNGPIITNAEYKNEKITVKGTGTGRIQLVLFNLDNSPIYMTTVMPEGDGDFSITLPKIDGLTDGNYKIKVADYNGEHINEKTVSVKLEKNPATGDNIMISVIIGGLCILGIAGCIILIKKKLV